jgi:hypothetical protein
MISRSLLTALLWAGLVGTMRISPDLPAGWWNRIDEHGMIFGGDNAEPYEVAAPGFHAVT